MQMRAIEKEMADEAYRISHILWDFPLRLEANTDVAKQRGENCLCKRRKVSLSLFLSLGFLWLNNAQI